MIGQAMLASQAVLCIFGLPLTVSSPPSSYPLPAMGAHTVVTLAKLTELSFHIMLGIVFLAFFISLFPFAATRITSSAEPRCVAVSKLDAVYSPGSQEAVFQQRP